LEDANNNTTFLNKKKKRNDEVKKESKFYMNKYISFNLDPNEVNELMKKIINYLLFVSKNLEKSDVNLDNDKECLIKVFEFLKEYKMADPIEFLKVKHIIFNQK
jgi:hypothetical protein